MLNETTRLRPVEAAPVVTRPHEPRGILITSRVNFDASIHAPLVRRLMERYGTKAFVFTGRATVAARWRKWLGEAAVVLNDEELRATAERMATDWPAVEAAAAAFESRYQLIYMRDILHQDKGIAAYYLQHSPSSAFARQKPPSLEFLVALVNIYFKTIEELLTQHPIDLFMTRASGLFNSVAVAVARQRKIPVTWLNHAQVGQQMIWMEGPDHASSLIIAGYSDVDLVAVVDAEMIAPPPDTVSARNAAQDDASVSKLAMELLRATVSKAITRGLDLVRFSWPRRLPLRGFVAQQITRWRTANYIATRAKADGGRLKKGRYILFLLHLDPEYSSSTLARRFNHTHAIIQQLALSLPIGYTLALKEHVIGLGNRSIAFYKELSHLPNVIFVDHRLKATDLARDAAAVATVWGTICLEASLMGVPVICFTDNSEFAALKNVLTARTPTEIPETVRRALRPRSEAEILDVRRDAARFRQAQLALSFPISTLDLDEHGNRNRNSFGLPDDELERAVTALLTVYRQGGGLASPVR